MIPEQKLLEAIINAPFMECISYWQAKKRKDETGYPKTLVNSKNIYEDTKNALSGNLLGSYHHSKRYVKLSKKLRSMNYDEITSFLSDHRKEITLDNNKTRCIKKSMVDNYL